MSSWHLLAPGSHEFKTEAKKRQPEAGKTPKAGKKKTQISNSLTRGLRAENGGWIRHGWIPRFGGANYLF